MDPTLICKSMGHSARFQIHVPPLRLCFDEGICKNRDSNCAGCWRESRKLLHASLHLNRTLFINMSRDFGYYWLRLLIYIVARGVCPSFVFGFVTFMSIEGFPSFVEDMKLCATLFMQLDPSKIILGRAHQTDYALIVWQFNDRFSRERGPMVTKGVSTFVISNTLSAMPILIMITFISGTICYFMVRLHPGFIHYLFFVLCLYASVTVVESLMMAIASIIPNFLMGIIIGASIQGIFLLGFGYFRLPKDIPKPVWRYTSYISFHFWALQVQKQVVALVRSVDLTKFHGYDELIVELDQLFEFENELLFPNKNWLVVYTDNEGDMIQEFA